MANSSSTPTFAEFWQAYPRKRGKDKAEKIWKGMRPEARQLAFAALPAYIDDYQRNNVAFMYPQGWLNQKRWRDYVEEDAGGGGTKTELSRTSKPKFDASMPGQMNVRGKADGLTTSAIIVQEPTTDVPADTLADMETW